MIMQPKNGEILSCSVCGKEFKVTDDTRYICNKGYTCSWKCFLDFIKAHPVEHKEKKKKEYKPMVFDFKVENKKEELY